METNWILNDLVHVFCNPETDGKCTYLIIVIELYAETNIHLN